MLHKCIFLFSVSQDKISLVFIISLSHSTASHSVFLFLSTPTSELLYTFYRYIYVICKLFLPQIATLLCQRNSSQVQQGARYLVSLKITCSVISVHCRLYYNRCISTVDTDVNIFSHCTEEPRCNGLKGGPRLYSKI